MIHALLDSSVLLAFCRSYQGGSGFIIRCCEEGRVKGYITQKVLFEVKKNSEKHLNESAVKALDYVFWQGFLTVIPDATGGELEKARSSFENIKDAPIIAGAKQATDIQFIISLDHGFFKPEVIEYLKPIEALTPGGFIQRFRAELEK